MKSSTASREDIEKSGLEIIKASALSALEEEGKVTSNCVDRVRSFVFSFMRKALT